MTACKTVRVNLWCMLAIIGLSARNERIESCTSDSVVTVVLNDMAAGSCFHPNNGVATRTVHDEI